jgi:hypothetical protein
VASKSANHTPTLEIFEKDGCYNYRKGNSSYVVSNFIMKIIHFIHGLDNPIRVVEIENKEGYKIRFDMPADAMRTPDSFCKTLEAKGNFIYSGSKDALFALKRHLFKEEKTAYSFPYLGYQKRFEIYAFSNGVYDCKGNLYKPDKNGIVSIEERKFYLPLTNSFTENSEDSDNQANNLFIVRESAVTFKEWAEAYIKAYGSKGIVGVSYALASINRDIIFGKIHSMPLLFLAGKPQTGKSAFRRGMMNLFGYEQAPIQCGTGSTQKALNRKLGQFANALVSVEEYKNEIQSKMIDTLKGAFDGEGYERAKKSNDNQTHSAQVLSSVLISGQHLPTKESALFSRCILLEFSQTEFSTEERTEFEKLIKIQECGLTHLVSLMFNHRAAVKNEFNEVFWETCTHLKSNFVDSPVSERIINNYAAILSPAVIVLRQNLIELPFSEKDVFDEFEKTLYDQVEHINATTELCHFWETFKLMMEQRDKLMETTHYQVKQRDGKAILFLRLGPVADLYREYCIKMRLLNALEGRTLTTYLKHDKAFIKGPGHGGCHYLNVMGEKKNFMAFEIILLPIQLLDEKSAIVPLVSNYAASVEQIIAEAAIQNREEDSN